MHTRLKSLRKFFNLSQSEFAEKLGISQTFLSAIELGNRDFPTRLFLRLIELNVNLEWLFTGKGTMFRAGPTSESPADTSNLLEEINNIIKSLSLKRQKKILDYAEDQKDLSKLLGEP